MTDNALEIAEQEIERQNKCRFCGKKGSDGLLFDKWVKPTFTDHDKLLPGEVVCTGCLFWFNEASPELAEKVGKDKPQRMRNYSHFVINGEWMPLSKGDKSKMAELLLSVPFPELAAIAESGQKHIVFRATRNPVGGNAGWVQFEEQSLWLEPATLKLLLDIIQPSLAIFSKGELVSGQYKPHRIMAFGLSVWQALEAKIKPLRGSLILSLAFFLAQKPEDMDAGNSSGFTGNRVARNRQRVQEPLSSDDLGAIREYGQGQRLHQQFRKIHQCSLFENVGHDTGKDDGAA